METWQFLTSLGIIFIIIEIFVPSFIMFPIGIGLLLSGLLSVYFPDPPEIVFITSFTIITVFFSMKYLFKYFSFGGIYGKNIGNLDKYINQRVLVMEKVSFEKKGKVKVFGEEWSAISISNTDCFMPSDHAIVKKISGNKLVIDKI